LIAVNEAGERQLFRLEPGSVNDVVWLLALIEERAGEPRSA
jgi:hypothetical protein